MERNAGLDRAVAAEAAELDETVLDQSAGGSLPDSDPDGRAQLTSATGPEQFTGGGEEA